MVTVDRMMHIQIGIAVSEELAEKVILNDMEKYPDRPRRQYFISKPFEIETGCGDLIME